MNYVGDFAVGQTVFIWFNTFDSNDPSASVTVTDLTDTDTVIYRDDSLTQRANTAGMTIDIDVDTFAGVHKLTIDTADNTVPDFYEAGHDYSVVAVGATVDGATGGINAVIGTFSIANRRQAGEMCRSAITTLASQTSFTLDTGTASAQNDAYNNCTIIVTDQTTRIQKAVGYISDYTGATRTVTLRDAPLATGYTMAVADSVEIFANSAFANVDSIKATDQTANDNGADINAILLDTAEIGTAGVGLSNIGTIATVTTVTNGVTIGADAITAAGIADNAFSNEHFAAGALTSTEVTSVADAALLAATQATIDVIDGADGLVAISAQIDGIGAASGGALNFAADDDNVGGAIIGGIVFDGTETGGTTFANVAAEDGVYHNITGGATSLDIVYRYPIGGGRTGVEMTWKGYLSSANDTATIQAWNGSGWDTIATIAGQAQTTTVTLTAPLLSAHTGTGSELGNVYIRIECAGMTNPDLFTDQLLVAAVNIGQSVGYEGGAVWFDGAASNTNTESFVDGVADNPVSTLAAARTIADAVGLKVIHCLPGTTATLTAASWDAFEMIGAAYNVALASRSIDGMLISGAIVTGIGEATTTQPIFLDCSIGAATIPPAVLKNCGIGNASGTFTAPTDAGEYIFHQCFSEVPGSGSPVFDFSAINGASGINNRAWRGGATYTLNTNCTLSHEVTNGGGTTITPADATVEVRGRCRALTLALSDTDVGNTIQCIVDTGPVIVTSAGSGDSATINLYGHAQSLADAGNGTMNNFLSGFVQTDAILADTNELQGDWANTGRLDTILDARMAEASIATTAGVVDNVNTVDGNVVGSVGSNVELGPAEVNAEVLDVLKTDTMTQSTLCPQEAPPVNATMEEAIAYLYKAWRNRSTQTSTTYSLYADNTTTQDQAATVDDDGTTADKGEVGTGT